MLFEDSYLVDVRSPIEEADVIAKWRDDGWIDDSVEVRPPGGN